MLGDGMMGGPAWAIVSGVRPTERWQSIQRTVGMRGGGKNLPVQSSEVPLSGDLGRKGLRVQGYKMQHTPTCQQINQHT